MYREVAFDPQCLAHYEYYSLLKQGIGFETGRYVVAPMKEWLSEAFAAAKNSTELAPIKRQSVKQFLNKMLKEHGSKRILLPKYRPIINESDWHNWYQAQVQFQVFDVVVSERVEEALTHDNILDNNQKWYIPPTTRIEKQVPSIMDVVGKLMRFGGEVTLIDQYFRLATNDVLHAIFDVLNSDKSITSLTLVTSVTTLNPQGVFDNEYKIRYPGIPKLKLIVAPERFFHDRYMMSSYGALKSGQGFADGVPMGAQSDRLSIGLCGQEECSETLGDLKTLIDGGKATVYCLWDGTT
uniref:hypothetical protein n=1 Tax=Rheinheimera sp. TaxID=1869214 RepID=UPI00404820F5